MKEEIKNALILLLKEGIITTAEYNRFRYGAQSSSGEIIQVDNPEAAREFRKDMISSYLRGAEKHGGGF